tara:strand:+ start:209 stop:493 length:285 start_codon:yes stop_codon:yes gene_type:complete
MYQTKNIKIIIPNHEPKKKIVLETNKNKPRYIGFLVKEKILVVTKDVVSSGCIGFTVVLSFLNKIVDNIAIATPNKRINPPIISMYGNLMGLIK